MPSRGVGRPRGTAFSERTGCRPVSWTPPPRPEWVERLIAHGDAVGGAEHLVGLESDELLRVAAASTGLDDFGGEEWRTPFDVLLRALREESDLHLAGRLLVRTELLRTLRNRLQLEALWGERPDILTEEVPEPVFIVGSPRSGTSILHELMACDLATRAPAMWEMQHPVEAVRGEDYGAIGDRVVQLAHDLQPEYETMHANSGTLPNECIFITLHAFLSDHWSGQHVVPSYDRFLSRADHRPAYRYHRRFLQTLQSTGGSRRWLLKAPSHLSQLRALFDIYPDARIVRTHRDPLETLPSAISLMGTLKWMRCRNVDMAWAAEVLPAAYAALYAKEIEDRTSGALPEDRFVDVPFGDLVGDPVGTVAGVYARLDWSFPQATRSAVERYARSKPRGSRGVHRYSLAGVGLDGVREAERFRFYLDRYHIRPESDQGEPAD